MVFFMAYAKNVRDDAFRLIRAGYTNIETSNILAEKYFVHVPEVTLSRWSSSGDWRKNDPVPILEKRFKYITNRKKKNQMDLAEMEKISNLLLKFYTFNKNIDV